MDGTATATMIVRRNDKIELVQTLVANVVWEDDTHKAVMEDGKRLRDVAFSLAHAKLKEMFGRKWHEDENVAKQYYGDNEFDWTDLETFHYWGIGQDSVELVFGNLIYGVVDPDELS